MNKIREPNYTQVPNIFLDKIMIGMSKAQLLVMLAICRQTFGWHRASCQLSLSDLQNLTGLGRQSVKNGIDELLNAGYLKREKVGRSYAYALVIYAEESEEKPKDQSKNKTVKSVSDQSKNKTVNSPKTRPLIVQKQDRPRHAIKEKEKEKRKKGYSSSANHDALAPDSKPPSLTELYWQTAYGDLQIQLPRETFNPYLQRARLISFENEVFTIGVENQRALEWLKLRLHQVVLDVLRRIVGRDVGVEFVLRSDI